MKKNKNLLILIILTILMFISILIYKNITPFGNNSFLDMDFFHQYFPMTGELYDRIKNKLSLVYSFNMGLGLPIYRNYFNYLSSPFNIIILLFKRSSMLSAYSIIIGLKVVFSSICTYLLLKKKFDDHFILVPIALMYTFSQYFIAYHWNIMWMDGFSFLPLVILGLEKLVDENKSLLYILSLSLVIYCNYYIAFMICIFCVLYFIMYVFTSNKYNKKELLKKCILFIISSLLVGLLCSFFLIPIYYSIKSISAVEEFSLPNSLYYGFKFRDFLFNHLSFIKSTVTHIDGINAPNISCGVLSLLLIIPFIFNKKINYKIKIGYLSLLIFLGISFHISSLDYLWHICHVPNDLPYRFSFLYSFVLIIISAYSIIKIKYSNKIIVILSYVLVMLLTLYLNIVGYEKIDNTYIISNYVLSTLYLIYYFIYILSKNKKIIPSIFICITVIINILLTININWNMDSLVSDFYNDYDNKKGILNEIQNHDGEIYRIGSEEFLTYNDSSWYGYRGINTFSSMEYKQVASLMNKLGVGGNTINSYYYSVGNKLTEILFNIKYGIYKDVDDNTYSYYEMPFNSSLMFMVNKDIYEWNINGDDPFVIQNDFVNKSYGITEIYKKLKPIKKEVIYRTDNGTITKYIYKSNNNNYYTYSNNTNLTGIIINDKIYLGDDNNVLESTYFELGNYSFEEYFENHIIEGYNDKDNIIIYTSSNADSIEPLVYEIKEDVLEKFSEEVINNMVEITSFNEDNITSNINSKYSGVIYTSIPYDKGWNVFVDGKKIETKRIGDALLAFDIEKGNHIIELKYSIPYLKVSVLISIISLITIIILNKKKII